MGNTLNAQTDTAFKQDLEYIAGLTIKIIHTKNSNTTINLFDFNLVIIYNIYIKISNINYIKRGKMDITTKILNIAKKVKGKIILPEANIDKRVYNACLEILDKKLADIVVFGKSKQFGEQFKTKACTIIDIESFEKLDEFANTLYELRKHKGLTLDQAKQLIKTPAYFACVYLYLGLADGMVAGAKWTTADTLRPALQVIKTKPNKSLIVGVNLMVKQNMPPLLFGDISLNENPNAEQLSEIAISSAEFYSKLVGEPKVAMLSYSTKGSANSEMVDKVRQATSIANKKSNYLIDGEMQVDSALDLATAKRKGLVSKVAGKANVLIFPDLNAGNIGYKLTQRLGGYQAIGPIMLNFNKPVNDLSRGCTVEEIVQTVCITKLLIEK